MSGYFGLYARAEKSRCDINVDYNVHHNSENALKYYHLEIHEGVLVNKRVLFFYAQKERMRNVIRRLEYR